MTILDTSNFSKDCDGKLGKNFKLKLITRLEEISEDTRRLFYTFLIDKVSDTESFIYYKNQVISSVRLNDYLINKSSSDLDFTSKQEGYILNSSFVDIPNDPTNYITIRCSLSIINNKSFYLSDTELQGVVYLPKVKVIEPKCSIKIIGETDSIVNFDTDTTNRYDLLELKVNDNSWHCLEGTRFNVAKLNKRQFVQTRVKINSEYYYSNVITINSKED